MRILHTSDWHIGRTFHGFGTLAALGEVLDALVEQVAEHRVELVALAGDVFDTATPSAEAFALLTDVLRRIRRAGARVVATSGNHDSAARLGFQAPLLEQAGVHIRTDPARAAEPITVTDEHGEVHVYGIPFLDPYLVRSVWPEAGLRTQEDAVRHALGLVRADRAARAGRSVVLAHCFAAGVSATEGVERDIRVGTLDLVPVEAFAGHNYVALGHIHGARELTPTVRYCGAPLHYSFGEQGRPRGSWLIDLGADGVIESRWLDLPIPRPLVTLTGRLTDLLDDDAFAVHEGSWVCAVLTDPVPPLDPMRRLRERFRHCAMIQLAPEGLRETSEETFRDRVAAARGDGALIEDFLDHVRGGISATDAERVLIADVIAEQDAAERI